LGQELAQSLADDALAPHAPIVDGRVEKVEAALKSVGDGLPVKRIGLAVLGAQVGDQADRGNRQVCELSEMPSGFSVAAFVD
jgi:hypothetical protein